MVSDRYGTNLVSCARETRLRACFVILDWNSEIDPSLNARWELDSENDDWSTHVPQTFVVPSESQSFSLCVLIHSKVSKFSEILRPLKILKIFKIPTQI